VIYNLLIRNINVLLTTKMEGERFPLKKYNSGLVNNNFDIFFIDYGLEIVHRWARIEKRDFRKESRSPFTMSVKPNLVFHT
jgi:hypothetical protein